MNYTTVRFALAFGLLGACNESQTHTSLTGNDDGPMNESSSGTGTGSTTNDPTTSTTTPAESSSTNVTTGESSTTPAESSGSSGIADGSGSSDGSSSSGGQASVCDPVGADDACWMCTRESCCDELEACYMDADCMCLADCIAAGSEAVTCFTETCALGNMPPGLAELQSCQYMACGDPCPP